MRIEVDQSGKIEQTNFNTVLAYSDGVRGSVLVKATTKRRLVLALRAQGFSGTWFYTLLFVVCLYLLLKKVLGGVTTVEIDEEYTGKQRIIKEELEGLFLRVGLDRRNLPEIYFRRVTKKSKAHYYGWAVFKKKTKPDRVLTFDEIMSVVKKRVG